MIWLVCHGDRVRRDAARTEVRAWVSLDNLAWWLKAQGCGWCEQGDGVLVTLKFFKTSRTQRAFLSPGFQRNADRNGQLYRIYSLATIEAIDAEGNAPDLALLALMRGTGKSAHHDLDPHDLPMRA